MAARTWVDQAYAGFGPFVGGRHRDPTVVVPALHPPLRTHYLLVRMCPVHRGTLPLFGAVPP